MLPTNESSYNETHPHYKKVILLSGVLLLIIIGGVLLWYLQRSKIPAEKTLTESQKETLTAELVEIAEEAPLTDEERYQMVTGRTTQ